MSISDKRTVSIKESARERYLRAMRRKKTAVRLTKIAVLALFFLSWESCTASGIADPFIVSSPLRLTATIVRLAANGELWDHVLITTAEAAAGFICGTALGVLCAAALWWNEFICRVAEPYLVVLNALPKIALGPIFIVWLGAGPVSIVVITLTISIVVSILETLNGFLATGSEMLLLVKTFGATKWQMFTKVVLPANVGTMINSLKVNVGMSWVGVIVGEFLVSKAGLGYLIVYGSQVFKLDLVMASVLILALIAALMYFGVVMLEKAVMKKRSA